MIKARPVELTDNPGVYGYVSTSMDKIGVDGVLNLPNSPSGLYKKSGDKYVKYNPPAPALDYKQKREVEYPPRGDQLDEIWKVLEELGATSKMLDAIKTVKIKHPKT